MKCVGFALLALSLQGCGMFGGDKGTCVKASVKGQDGKKKDVEVCCKDGKPQGTAEVKKILQDSKACDEKDAAKLQKALKAAADKLSKPAAAGTDAAQTETETAASGNTPATPASNPPASSELEVVEDVVSAAGQSTVRREMVRRVQDECDGFCMDITDASKSCSVETVVGKCRGPPNIQCCPAGWSSNKKSADAGATPAAPKTRDASDGKGPITVNPSKAEWQARQAGQADRIKK